MSYSLTKQAINCFFYLNGSIFIKDVRFKTFFEKGDSDVKKLIVALIAIIMTSSAYAIWSSAGAVRWLEQVLLVPELFAGVSVATAVAIGAAVVGIAVAADDDDDEQSCPKC